MKTLTCSSCKAVHPWDYDRSYKALVESGLPSREIKCLCGNPLTTIKINKDIPSNSVIAKVNRESQIQREIIEERMKKPQILCPGCNKPSGWYKEREHESMPLGHKKNLVCQHCATIVLIIEGGAPEKFKQMNKPKVDIGYVGKKEELSKKQNKKKIKRRVKTEKVPIINWD